MARYILYIIKLCCVTVVPAGTQIPVLHYHSNRMPQTLNPENRWQDHECAGPIPVKTCVTGRPRHAGMPFWRSCKTEAADNGPAVGLHKVKIPDGGIRKK
jgi:hypothetical protein